MLNNKKITIVADSNVDDVKIATFGAVLDVNNMELSMTGRYIDKEACKSHRDIVRDDQAEFEDYAYALQDTLRGVEEADSYIQTSFDEITEEVVEE